MQYIAHNRYKGKDINGNDVLIRRNKLLERKGDVLFYNNIPICIYRSLIGKQYFANNEDGNGLRRGIITYTLAYEPRVCYSDDGIKKQRFTDEQLEILNTQWKQYLKPNCDMLLFNDEFFEEDVSILQQIADSIHVEIPVIARR